MAADPKDSVLPVASLLRENQGFNSQEKGPGSYTWQREIQTTQDHRTINDILERRGTEVRTLYEQCQESDGKCRHLEEEWLALVTEKDRNLREQIEKENEEAKRNQMKQLYGVLESLGTFSFDKPNEAILKRNLAKMYHQIGKYCSRNNIDITKKTKDATKSVDAPTENIFAPPLPPQMLIPPPPPPPPLVLTPVTFNKAPKRKVCQSQSQKNSTPTTKAHSSTPLNQANEELLKRIRNGCRSELRSTSFKRSPGGTPLKRQRRMSENDTSDLITVALKRKFQNVVFQSPKDNDSPRSVTSPGNFKCDPIWEKQA